MHREIYMPCQTSQYYFWPEIPKCSVIYWMEKLLQYSCKQKKLCSYHIYFINKLKWNLKLKNNVCVVSLKPELFEGMRFDFTKGLNPKFSLSHRYVPFILAFEWLWFLLLLVIIIDCFIILVLVFLWDLLRFLRNHRTPSKSRPHTMNLGLIFWTRR